MRKLLFALIISANVYAEEFKISDIPLPSTIDRAKWLHENEAIPDDPKKDYGGISDKIVPLKPGIHCSNEIYIFGGCATKQVYKKIKYSRDKKLIEMQNKYNALTDQEKNQFMLKYRNALILKPNNEIKRILKGAK